MLAKTPLRDQMIAWLETQDPTQTYQWFDGNNCVCAQFAKAIDRFDEWLLRNQNGMVEWNILNRIAMPPNPDPTFGEVLERLNASEERL